MNNSHNLWACSTHCHLPLVGRVEGEVSDCGHGGAPHPRVIAVVIVEELLQFDEAPGLSQVVLEESIDANFNICHLTTSMKFKSLSSGNLENSLDFSLDRVAMNSNPCTGLG